MPRQFKKPYKTQLIYMKSIEFLMIPLLFQMNSLRILNVTVNLSIHLLSAARFATCQTVLMLSGVLIAASKRFEATD